jgi:TPP-dependent pyruvate/acetoin dehydrogenase alpha subunit
VLASYAATREAVDRARAGEGPTLIELVTYRLSVHTTADDPGKYRSEEQEQKCIQRDPLHRFQRYLTEKDLLDEDHISELEDEIKQEITAAWEEAADRMESLEKQTENLFDHVYEEFPKHLEEQRQVLTGAKGNGEEDA